MTTPTRRLLPPFLQSPVTSAAPSAPASRSRVVAGLVEFSARILSVDDADTAHVGRLLPDMVRRGLEAGLPMLERQMQGVPEAELVAGIRFFTRELERIAALADDPGTVAELHVDLVGDVEHLA